MLKLLALLMTVSFLTPMALADDQSPDDAVTACLKAWGQTPFGAHPKYKTMATSVKIFGLGGSSSKDLESTKEPALVLVNPAVNVMGSTTFELMNPNGWYCFKANVNVMGSLKIKANCKAHVASSTTGATVFGSDTETHGQGVTVMGSTKIKLVGCKDKEGKAKNSDEETDD